MLGSLVARKFFLDRLTFAEARIMFSRRKIQPGRRTKIDNNAISLHEMFIVPIVSIGGTNPRRKLRQAVEMRDRQAVYPAGHSNRISSRDRIESADPKCALPARVVIVRLTEMLSKHCESSVTNGPGPCRVK